MKIFKWHLISDLDLYLEQKIEIVNLNKLKGL